MNILKINLGIALYILSLLYGREAYESIQCTQVLLDHPILGAEVQQIQELEWEAEAPIGFCFWGQGQSQLVTCKETGEAATVTPIFLAGNPELMDAGALAWREGCLLDRETAVDLFGTAKVGSQVLWYQGRAYPVLGIAEAARPTVVLMADADTELNQILLALPPEQGSVEGPQCLLRWGIQGKILDTTLIGSLISNSLLIFPCLLVFLICGHWGKGWRELRWEGIIQGKQWKLLGRITFCALFFLGAVWFLSYQVVIPRSMIPSKWSDFSFWSRWWQGEQENLTAMAFAPVGNRQLQMRRNMVKSVVRNLLACLVLIWPKRR